MRVQRIHNEVLPREISQRDLVQRSFQETSDRDLAEGPCQEVSYRDFAKGPLDCPLWRACQRSCQETSYRLLDLAKRSLTPIDLLHGELAQIPYSEIS